MRSAVAKLLSIAQRPVSESRHVTYGALHLTSLRDGRRGANAAWVGGQSIDRCISVPVRDAIRSRFIGFIQDLQSKIVKANDVVFHNAYWVLMEGIDSERLASLALTSPEACVRCSINVYLHGSLQFISVRVLLRSAAVSPLGTWFPKFHRNFTLPLRRSCL